MSTKYIHFLSKSYKSKTNKPKESFVQSITAGLTINNIELLYLSRRIPDFYFAEQF